jgi:L-ribulokinase
MKISRSAQTCALGAAIFGAVAGGAYKQVEQAQRKMTGVKDHVYRPNKAAAKTYAELYGLYRTLHDAFGTNRAQQNLGHVMKQLIAIRNRTRRSNP